MKTKNIERKMKTGPEKNPPYPMSLMIKTHPFINAYDRPHAKTEWTKATAASKAQPEEEMKKIRW